MQYDHEINSRLLDGICWLNGLTYVATGLDFGRQGLRSSKQLVHISADRSNNTRLYSQGVFQ
jgi:hypothetical protein